MGTTQRQVRRRATGLAIVLATTAGVLGLTATPASAAAPPNLQASLGSLDFGHVALGTTSAAQAVTITNRGPGTASGLTIGTPTQPVFSRTTTCGATLAAGASCTVSYRYAPTVAVESYALARASAAGGSTVQVGLHGLPDSADLGLRVTPTAFDFGYQAVGTTSAARSVLITNQSGASAQFSYTLASAGAPFAQVGGTCGPSPVTLTNGTTCTVPFTFSPTTSGKATRAATLTVSRTGVGSRTYPLSFQGYGGTSGGFPVEVSPRSFDFGRVALGATSPTQSVLLTNRSAATVSVSVGGGAAGAFGGYTTCGSPLAPGASCRLDYMATLSEPGLNVQRSGIQITYPDGRRDDAEFNFTGYGVGTAPRLEVPRTSIDLGPSSVGTPTASIGIVVHNSGSAPLTGLGIVQSGTADARFTSTGSTCGSTLAAGATCTYDVRYTPTDLTRQGVGYRVTTDAGTRSVQVQGGARLNVHEAFATYAYEVFLGRAPSPSELAAASSALDAGTTSRPAVVQGLANSTEWIQAVVQSLYYDTLGRPGDPGGTAFWVNKIKSGKRTVAQVSASFYGSNEYYEGIGGGTDTSWVKDLYQKLLHRPADSSGLAYWVGQTASHGRDSVAYRMFQSPESRRSRVMDLYDEILQREPDAAGVAYWAGRIETQGDIALAINLASSNEFLRLASANQGTG